MRVLSKHTHTNTHTHGERTFTHTQDGKESQAAKLILQTPKADLKVSLIGDVRGTLCARNERLNDLLRHLPPLSFDPLARQAGCVGGPYHWIRAIIFLKYHFARMPTMSKFAAITFKVPYEGGRLFRRGYGGVALLQTAHKCCRCAVACVFVVAKGPSS